MVNAYLRDVEYEDLTLILKWRNNESIRSVMVNDDLISWEEHLRWFENFRKNDTTQSKLFIFNEQPYGILNIKDILPLHKTCQWGFYLRPYNTPKGMGKVLGFTSLNYIFNDLKIRKLNAEVLGSNSRSRKFHLKMGFSEEGVLKNQLIKSNSFEDVHLFGCFSKEWFEKSLEIKKEIEGIKYE